jgi:hypothetical protein
MKLIALTATLAFLIFGAAPAFAGGALDDDGDTIPDFSDNCSSKKNAGQVDTDGDDCGNICDFDYDQNGVAGLPDFGKFTMRFGKSTAAALESDHTEPVTGPVGLPDFDKFTMNFGKTPGPSGTTASNLACP